MNRIVVITGPTASGKSSLGVDIAKKIGGEIISCDSMQVYRQMDIGTAKISDKEMSGIKHHMIDIADPREEFSVGEYSKRARLVIDSLLSKNITPIIVGGSGLYIDSILYNMSFGGNKNEDIRNLLDEECSKFGKEHMYAKLSAIDPEDAAKIHPNNVKRVIRALEIYYATGSCKSEMDIGEKELRYDCIMAVLNPPREILYNKINERVDNMFELGLESEVESLLSSGVTFRAQSMQAIGYKEFEAYFSKEIDIDTLKDKIKQNSRNYAKRQITWLKKYSFAKWFDPQTDIAGAEKFILDNLRG